MGVAWHAVHHLFGIRIRYLEKERERERERERGGGERERERGMSFEESFLQRL